VGVGGVVAAAAGATGPAVVEPLGADVGLVTPLFLADLCLRLLPNEPLVIFPLLDLMSPLPMFFSLDVNTR
jgi:hypothetical protein